MDISLGDRSCKCGTGEASTRSGALFTLALDKPLKILTSQQVQKIGDALAGLGPFAEVRLVKNRGKLRFIQKVESKSIAEESQK